MQTRSEMLEAMGIEVWRLRGSASIEVPVTPAARLPIRPEINPLPELEPAAVSPETVAPVSSEPVPQFRLAFLHYQTLGICLALEPGEEVPRRFCDDIARFLGGEVSDLKFQLLDWPMLNTSGIDQSLTAARQVVTQKFNLMPSKVLVFGNDVSTYFGPLEKAELDNPVLVGRQQYLVTGALRELMPSTAGKRHLLSILIGWE